MSNNKALMTHYAEGAIVSRELAQMLNDQAAERRFDLEMATELEEYAARHHVHIHKGNENV